MRSKRTDNPTHSRSGSELNQPLPAQLATKLKPKTRQALMHGARRQILRTLHRDPTPRTTKDFLGTFPGLSLSSVNYHLLVLNESGSLSASKVNTTDGNFSRLLISNVADDPEFATALRATESLDDVR
jgi:DNA-binding transcriptional ArsR family regulator